MITAPLTGWSGAVMVTRHYHVRVLYHEHRVAAFGVDPILRRRPEIYHHAPRQSGPRPYRKALCSNAANSTPWTQCSLCRKRHSRPTLRAGESVVRGSRGDYAYACIPQRIQPLSALRRGDPVRLGRPQQLGQRQGRHLRDVCGGRTDYEPEYDPCPKSLYPPGRTTPR